MPKHSSVFSRKFVRILLLLSVPFVLLLLFFNSSVSVSPKTENQAMARLEALQSQAKPVNFTTDGCSGGLSTYWPSIMNRLADIYPTYADNYSLETVPFEKACTVHDRAYHQGAGGYVGRLEADNAFRLSILNYGIENAPEIKNRMGLQSDVEAIFLYEALAETIYLSVRAGGAPCTGQPYQWGYGYTTDTC